MAHIIYTDEQMKILLANPHISKCSSKYITFTPECRQKALHLYEHVWWSPRRIFESLLFPDFITQSTLPRDSLKRWRKMVKQEWLWWLKPKTKGRKKKERDIENRTPEEQILYLQAKVAYLEHENNFLRLLRAED